MILKGKTRAGVAAMLSMPGDGGAGERFADILIRQGIEDTNAPSSLHWMAMVNEARIVPNNFLRNVWTTIRRDFNL